MAQEFSTISEKKMREFGRDYVKILSRFLLSNRPYAKRATGSLLNSLNFKLLDDATQIQLIANDYLKYVDKGVSGTEKKYNTPFRYTTKMPPIQAISRWASVKGIPQSAVFGIRKNIFKFGIAPTNVIQKTVTEIETSKTLQRKYEEEGINNLLKLINENFKYI